MEVRITGVDILVYGGGWDDWNIVLGYCSCIRMFRVHYWAGMIQVCTSELGPQVFAKFKGLFGRRTAASVQYDPVQHLMAIQQYWLFQE